MWGATCWHILRVGICFIGSLSGTVAAVVAGPAATAGQVPPVSAELPCVRSADLTALDFGVEGRSEGNPQFLAHLNMLTAGRATRYVQAVLTRRHSEWSHEVQFASESNLVDISFCNWPAGGPPGIVRCDVAVGADGHQQPMLTETLLGAGRWTTRQIDLSAWTGRSIVLGVKAESVDAAEFRVFVSITAPYGRSSRERPNLIMICLDTLRADHMGCYGYERETSPFMDKLARRGVRFARCNSQASWTLPSLWSAFTGQYPSCNCSGKWLDEWRFNAEAATLALLLSRQGLSTAAVTGGGVTTPEYGLATGFGVYETVPDDGKIPAVYGRSLEWLRDHVEERFFLFFHTYEVHDPYLRRLFLDGDDTPADEAVRNYDSGILFADSYIEQLFDRLGELGLLEKSFIVIFADHGEDFREVHDTVAGPAGRHGQCLFQTILHVPLIFVGPNVPAGRVVEERVELMDLMPTVLELLGIPVPEGTQADSLVALMSGTREKGEGGNAFSERVAMGPEQEALICGDFKVIRRSLPEEISEESEWYWRLPAQELHDLRADPEENVNSLDARADMADKILAELRQIVAENERIRKSNEGGMVRAGAEETPEDTLQQLGQLGYLP